MLVVTQHHLRAPHCNLAHLTGWYFHLPRLSIDNSDFIIRHRQTRRAGFVYTIHRGDHGSHHRLGHGITLDDISTRQCLKPLLGIDHQRCCTRDAIFDRLEAYFARLDIRMVNQGDKQGWDTR